MDTRELFARLIQCEAGGEGTDGMMGVATVVMNRATINYGEFARINGGGDIRSVIEQPGQFTWEWISHCFFTIRTAQAARCIFQLASA